MKYPPLTEKHIWDAVESSYESFNWPGDVYSIVNADVKGCPSPDKDECEGTYWFDLIDEDDSGGEGYWKFKLYFKFDDHTKDWKLNYTDLIDSP